VCVFGAMPRAVEHLAPLVERLSLHGCTNFAGGSRWRLTMNV